MSKPYYVKVEIPKEIAEASYEALRQENRLVKSEKVLMKLPRLLNVELLN